VGEIGEVANPGRDHSESLSIRAFPTFTIKITAIYKFQTNGVGLFEGLRNAEMQQKRWEVVEWTDWGRDFVNSVLYRDCPTRLKRLGVGRMPEPLERALLENISSCL
jgi:hypothetical protein